MLPDWIKQDETNPFRFNIEPADYYQKVLGELWAYGTKHDIPELTKRTQYTLEVAHVFLRLDAQAHIRLSGLVPADRSTTLHIKYDPDWKIADAPRGDLDPELAWRKDGRRIHKEIRG